MRLIKDLTASTKRDVREQVGAEEMDAFEELLANTSVPNCPFCRGEAVLELYSVLTSVGISICCESCRIKTRRFLHGQMANGRYYSLSDRLNQAAALWSRRV